MSKIKFLILVIIIAFMGVYPLLHSGLPPTHDGEYHVIRFYEFHKVLTDGSIYPRWAPDLNNGFGVPLFNFVYPLPNYFSSALHFLGVGFIDAFKLNLFFATLFGAVFFYLWTRKYWGDWGGLVCSVFYSFAPYRFVDIYIRGSVGEAWALSFFPGFLWTIDKFFDRKEKKYLGISAIFLALTIFSHNILGLMFFIFGFLYACFKIFITKKRKDVIKEAILPFVLSVGLSAVFWIPALFESKFSKGLEVFDIKSNFPDFYQLIIPSWGSGFSGTGSIGSQMSFQIGLANLLVIIISIILMFKIKGEPRKILFFFLGLFVIVIFLMLDASFPLWEKIPLLNYFQFPWRLLSLEILIAAFLSGSLVSYFKNRDSDKLAFISTLFLVFIAVGLSISYAKPPFYHNRDDNYYISRENFINGTNSPGNVFNTVWIKEIPKKADSKIVVDKGKAKIVENFVKSNDYSFMIEPSVNSRFVINTAYFPGWKVYDNGKEIPMHLTEKGLFMFDLEKGNHFIEVKFTDTMIRKVAESVSVMSFIFVVFLIFKKK